MADVRPKWQSVSRPSLRAFAVAVASADAKCVCGGEVLEDEPIACVGAYTIEDADGHRTVDLSGAQWRCQRCVGQVVARG